MNAPLRTCKVCGEAKPFERSTWVWNSVQGCKGYICKVCHNAKSLVITARDPARHIAASRKCQAANPECGRRSAAKYRAANSVAMNAKTLAWRAKYPERQKVAGAAWYAKHPGKAKELRAKFHAANPGYATAAFRRRELAKEQRTPKWVDSEHVWLMQEAYALSVLRTQFTGIQWHVDHRIPLRGKRVSGLHVIGNLQVIPARVNLSKGRQYAI